MLKKSDILGIVKTGIILFIITGVAAFILAAVNNVTAPVIAENNEKNQAAAMKKVMPEAEDFKKEENYPEDEIVSQAYSALKGSEVIGYAVIAEPIGYGGGIAMVVGVDTEGKVTGVDITSQSETAGLGANCTKDEFKDQFTGKSAGIEVVKSGAKDNEIDAITSATITSKAVAEGVNAAIEAAEKLSGEAK